MSNKLVEDNIKLVYHIISRDYPTYIKDEDIIQSGMLGLCKAAKYWKEQGLFSTYAGKCIRQEICQEFIRRKKHAQVISLDTRIGEEDDTLVDVIVGDSDVQFIDDNGFYRTLTNIEQDIWELKSKGYSTCEIADELDLSVKKTQTIIRKLKLKWKTFNGV